MPPRHRMPGTRYSELERRVLLVASTRRDAEVTSSLLARVALRCVVCQDFRQLRREVEAGAGVILSTGEAVAAGETELLEMLENQPPWSDLPVILLIKGGDHSPVASRVSTELRNVTLLERPAPTRSVISAVQAAVRARERQYQIRDQLLAIRAEQAHSRRLQEELALAVNASELGTFHCPMPPRDIYWNARCKELFWLPPDAEITFDLFYAIIHPDDREPVRAAINACIDEDQPYRVTYRTVSPGGEIRYVLATGRTFYHADGEPLRFDGTAQDVTDQKLAEEAMRASMLRFHQLADAMPQIVWTARPDGVLDYVNQRWYEYIQQSEAEAPPADWHVRVHPDDIANAIEVWTAAVTGGTPYATEFRVRGSDETYRWFLVRALPIRGADGKITQWYGTCTDIQDKRALHEQNALLLESERAARAEAERASQIKDEFLATLSHELRTPLNAILGWANVLRGDPADTEGVAEGLAIIERNARAQNQIIEDLLDMSRIISGKVRLDVHRLALAPIVEAAIETVRPAADAKGIRIHTGLDPAAQPVSCDPNRLQQVFWNLLSNAIKFTPRGGCVQVLLERVDSHLEVSVIDTGRGIEANFLPHVFDRFRQADSSTTRQYGGLGLGLAIVKQLVELHGGTVRVKSGGRDLGTTFIVALPLTVIHPEKELEGKERRHPEQSKLPAPALARDLDLRDLHVLVVDDEADARALVRRLLEERGATVTTNGSAAEAIASIRQQHFDVLVSDIGMPEEDGYALIRKVRAIPADQGGTIPAVALTAYAHAEDRMKAVSAGFQVHVTKPVEPAELLTIVASLAGRGG